MTGHHRRSRRSKRYSRGLGGPASRSASCDCAVPVGGVLTACAHPAIQPCRRNESLFISEGKIRGGDEGTPSSRRKALRPLCLKYEPAARGLDVDVITALPQ